MKKLLLLLFLAGCEDVVDLHSECHNLCALDSEGHLLLDEAATAYTCQPGRLQCDGDTTYCWGDAAPDSEVCLRMNGDCAEGLTNGEVARYYDYRNTCRGLGVCQYSEMLCLNGSTVCLYPPEYGPEVCDSDFQDENCNGLINEEDPELMLQGPAFDYAGPPGTVNHGVCRAGERKCESGIEYMDGEIRPSEEVCGNFKDDDCDDMTDEDDNDAIAEAYVLDLDFSGSMTSTIGSVTEALCDWAITSTFVNSKFAIRTVAADYLNAPYISNLTEFVTAEEACDALQDYMLTGEFGGGYEYMPYSIWSIRNDPEISLTWPVGLNRRVIFFTDEPPDGYLDTIQAEMLNVADDCVANNYSVSGFISGDTALWRIMTDACMGWLEHLSYDADDMRDSLSDKFGAECPVDG